MSAGLFFFSISMVYIVFALSYLIYEVIQDRKNDTEERV